MGNTSSFCNHNCIDKIHSSVYQFVEKDDWDVGLKEMENFLSVFDAMPPRMKMVVDFKIQGMSNKEIAKQMNVSIREIQLQVVKAKKRILRGENIL
ncbi:MAG: hypothetical protein FJ241_10615 [Nitrospira sp.]|nr:hypothetical protein [Nitrospira sp.]